MNELSTAAVIVRLFLGLIMLAHGYNHLLGPGGVAGTARWFGSIGLVPPRVHAWVSGLLEVAIGVAALSGFLMPLTCAGVVGIMTVAGVAAHRPNGFFVFRDGYEYVLFVSAVATALACMGAGRYSIDHVIGSGLVAGWPGLTIAAGGGILGAVMLLAVSWRPQKVPAPSADDSARSETLQQTARQ